ncbi:phosphoserine phosphatase [Neisseria sp. HSC-16F19]|nr:phosphoserine phosphatase SerB [Neisseria sp. HSC-16F19]MCP2039636.1 phosphoserine phosphatase [Neisseria sp. HSC-16F19]
MSPNVLVLQHADILQCDLQELTAWYGPLPAPLFEGSVLRLPIDEGRAIPAALQAAWDAQHIDWAVLPDYAFADLGLIVSDMDSTLITIECVDEIAAGVGLKDKVTAITERSMRGELDFAASLRERVALLQGLPESELARVYDEVLRLTPGAEYLLAECKRHNVKFMLVSGGFTYFTDRLQQQLGLDYAYANVLESDKGRLTGRLLGRMIDAQAKADLLAEYRERLQLSPQQTLAMGDGANDIPMIAAAGFGVAYRAKPKTEAAADIRIRHGGLDAVRKWFG